MNLEYGKLEKYPIEWCPNFIRIGNIDEKNPNHFFHAINYGFKSFRELSYDDKIKYIEKQRHDIANKITKDKWSSFGFYNTLQLFQSNVFKYRHNDLEKYEIILKIIPSMDEMILQVFKNISIQEIELKQIVFQEFKQLFSIYLDDIETKENKNLSHDKKNKCKSLFQDYLDIIWTYSENLAFSNFMQELKNPKSCIDFYLLPLIISYLPFNIFFIDNDTKDIISLNEFYDHFLKTQKNDINVFILYKYPSYFESLGIMEIMENGNAMISRLFTSDSDIIQKCLQKISIS
jgi:hypothetical protein